MAASYGLAFLGSAQAVTIGDTAVLSSADSQNANLLLAQSAKLTQTATIESLSFYVTAASGNLILGIYDAAGTLFEGADEGPRSTGSGRHERPIAGELRGISEDLPALPRRSSV
jgi:hypothetical protein